MPKKKRLNKLTNISFEESVRHFKRKGQRMPNQCNMTCLRRKEQKQKLSCHMKNLDTHPAMIRSCRTHSESTCAQR